MSNNIDWICVHKTTVDFEAEAIKGNLETQGIPTIILNKKDSSYQNFGYIEIHVDKTREQEALAFINNNYENN
jgi:ABC-type Fe2+-enterobactin transport system substrate-binding protein